VNCRVAAFGIPLNIVVENKLVYFVILMMLDRKEELVRRHDGR
jgi:hypothetical protein